MTRVGNLTVADVHVFAQTSDNCVFTNHINLHVRTRYALNVILGVLDVAVGAFVSKPLNCGGMIIDTKTPIMMNCINNLLINTSFILKLLTDKISWSDLDNNDNIKLEEIQAL